MVVHLTGGSAMVFLLGVPLAIGIVAFILLHSAMWGLVISVGIVVLMFTVAALPIKRKATRQDVAKAIEDFVSGSGGPWDRDNFISCRVAGEELEGIRIKCLRTQSEHPSGAIGWCNEQGIQVLRDSTRQLRSKE
jgi:hypothetical protein